ncbi:matrin 3-like 1.1 isoform X2 [Triplophysa dalaica]|uniref:matrin 3-like 1.1 isoform X2 n=1 Tax=Triplophysa dalaica TaxID=1582913 RepID=UPI0024E00DFE|nr:matrin 3-like 1.1 isoform X2 [Triplophysa dalaica]
MSYNNPYRKPQDGFITSHDMYLDSQRTYHRESGAYRSRVGTTSPEQIYSALSLTSEELSSIPPGKALSFLQSCGLDAGDLKTLAELPEHLISAEKLPELLGEIKKKKAANMSSSRSCTLQQGSSSRSWEDRRYTKPVEYSLDLPGHQSYSHHREQGQTLDDQWGNVQPASSSAHTYTTPESNFVVDYNHLKDKDTYFDKAPYATESSRQKTTALSQSYSNYSRDDSQPAYLSSRDDSQPVYLSSIDVGRPSQLSSRDVGRPSQLSSRDVGRPSQLSSRDVGRPSQLSSRDVGRTSQLSSRDVGQSSHLSSRDVGKPSYVSSKVFGQPSYLSSRDVSQSSHLSSRDVGKPSYLSSKDVGQTSYLSSKDVGRPSYLPSRDVGQPSYLASKNVVQPSYLASKNVGQPSYLASKNVGQPLPLIPNLFSRTVGQLSNLSSSDGGRSSFISSRGVSRSPHQSSKKSQPSHLSGRNVGQPSHHQKAGVHKVPNRKEASDFHGRTPPVFPYACVLCEITVLSNKDWSVHINGPQHANSQLSLVERYPEWDQKIHSARRNEPVPEKQLSRTRQERGETSSSRNDSSSSRSGLSGNKSSNNLNKTEVNEKCKMVCVKFEVDEVNEAYLKQLLGQFGAIVKLTMFSRMAFVEMGSTDQAGDVVKYFLQNPLKVKAKLLEFSLSSLSSCSMIQTSCVVSFMPLPAGEGVSSELTAIAKRFGSVKHSLFLPSRGYVEMGSAQEASKLVEHYSTNSLKLKGKTIHVSFSAEYLKLGPEKEEPVTRSSNRRRRSLSPQRRSRSSRRDSPSPKRRSSVETSRSRRNSYSRKRRRSKEKSGQNNLSRSLSRKSPSKDQSKQTAESAEEKTEDKMDQSDTLCDDSDLEGVAVIADDCEELNSEDEDYIEIDQEDDEDQGSSVALDEQDESEDMQDVKESDDIGTDVYTIKSGSVLKDTIADGSSECKDVKELLENQEATKEETEEGTDGSMECKEAQELREHEEIIKEESVQRTNGTLECKEAQELQETKGIKKEESTDGSLECKVSEELQENQGIQNDKTVDISDGSTEIVNESQQNQEATKDDTVESTDGSLDCKENQEVQKDETVEILDVPSECKEPQELQQHKEVQKDNTDAMEQEASDVPMNLDGCITLEEFKEEMSEKGDAEEISSPSTGEEYGRVLEVKGFPPAKKYNEDDLLNIGKKCGEVAGCCVVRNHRKVEKALIEMVNASDASKLEAESKRQSFKLGGKVLRITVSTKYTQIKKRH